MEGEREGGRNRGGRRKAEKEGGREGGREEGREWEETISLFTVYLGGLGHGGSSSSFSH